MKELDEIVFEDIDGSRHSGNVLGVEDEYFWLYVSELKMVYVGHPSRIIRHQGVNYFSVFDMGKSVDEILESKFASGSAIFSYSACPDKLLANLNMYNLVS